MPNENDKLKNIYKLRNQFKKDLSKKGINYESNEEMKKKKTTIYNYDLESNTLNIPIIKLKTWMDFVIYDINISDEKLSLYFENRLSSKSPSEYNNQFGLMHLLRNDFEKAENFFLSGRDIESLFNLGVLKVFRGDQDKLKFAKSLVEKKKNSHYPYFLMGLIFLKENKFEYAYKFIKIAGELSNYTFVNMAINLYNKNFKEVGSLISKAFLEGRAKKTVSLFIYYNSQFTKDVDKSTSALSAVKKDEFPCTKCIQAFNSNKSDYSIENYCLFSNKIFSYVDQNKIKIGVADNFENNFLKFYNMKNYKGADSIFDKMVEMFGSLDIVLFKTKVNLVKKGLKTNGFFNEDSGYRIRLKGPNYSEELNKIIDGFSRKYRSYFDFIIDIPFYESLRLLYGWKTCKRIYK
ncbi:MAG: hypothetical protein PWQ85_679 [Geotoga sp.]|jgi:hypothetical protein|nr:hypothetical protein [Geotoga sp.]